MKDLGQQFAWFHMMSHAIDAVRSDEDLCGCNHMRYEHDGNGEDGPDSTACHVCDCPCFDTVG